MDSYFLYTIWLSLSFLIGFMFARALYLSELTALRKAFNKKSLAYRKVISSFRNKYILMFKRNNILEEKINRLSPELFTAKKICNKIIFSKN